MNKIFRRACIQTPLTKEREKVCVERQPTGEWLVQISAIGGQSSFVMLIVTLKELGIYSLSLKGLHKLSLGWERRQGLPTGPRKPKFREEGWGQ